MTLLTDTISLETLLMLGSMVVGTAVAIGYYKGQTEKMISDNVKSTQYLSAEFEQYRINTEKIISRLENNIKNIYSKYDNDIKDKSKEFNKKIEYIEKLYKDNEASYKENIQLEIAKLVRDIEKMERYMSDKEKILESEIIRFSNDLKEITNKVVELEYYRKVLYEYELPRLNNK